MSIILKELSTVKDSLSFEKLETQTNLRESNLNILSNGSSSLNAPIENNSIYLYTKASFHSTEKISSGILKTINRNPLDKVLIVNSSQSEFLSNDRSLTCDVSIPNSIDSKKNFNFIANDFICSMESETNFIFKEDITNNNIPEDICFKKRQPEKSSADKPELKISQLNLFLELSQVQKEIFCRFCFKKFDSVQAMGGHMGRLHPNQSKKLTKRKQVKKIRTMERNRRLFMKKISKTNPR